MTVSEMFTEFLTSLKMDNIDQISRLYGEITESLNKKFRNTESKTDNSLQVGSYGRRSAIKGISDLDMLYIMPQEKWQKYKDGKQYSLLTDTRDAISKRYPDTNVKVDRLVVTVTFSKFQIEVQPVFEQSDKSYKYPDTYNGGSWKITKPREELSAMKEFNSEKNDNLRRLCKMARAWKNKHGVGMGGLLIDTLVHNFLKSTTEYDSKSYSSYDVMSRDFFKYLMDRPKDQKIYKALGSGQNVKVKSSFQRKAKKAHNLCIKAIATNGSDSAGKKWKKIFGRPFPSKAQQNQNITNKSSHTWNNTEQLIEDHYTVDIKFNLELECSVTQVGFRKRLLTEMLEANIPLKVNKDLHFYIRTSNIPEPYDIKWKVLNRGLEAERRNCIRGKIFDDYGLKKIKETTDFTGEHIVECYAIKNSVVVAKDRIDVPITAS